MQPDAFDLIRGVRTLLLESILPQASAPHLKMQVGLAIGMLDAAARELDDSPTVAGERQRILSLASAMFQAFNGTDISVQHPARTILSDAIDAAPPVRKEKRERSVRAAVEESGRLLALLDVLSTLSDEYGGASPRFAHIAEHVNAALRAHVARRASWGNPGSP